MVYPLYTIEEHWRRRVTAGPGEPKSNRDGNPNTDLEQPIAELNSVKLQGSQVPYCPLCFTFDYRVEKTL
jgi:hypothetical protein